MFVCGVCHISLERTELGVTIIEMFSRPPKPYKLWKADVLTCPRCLHETVQSAQQPYAEHWQDGFSAQLEEAKASEHYFAFERVADSDNHFGGLELIR